MMITKKTIILTLSLLAIFTIPSYKVFANYGERTGPAPSPGGGGGGSCACCDSPAYCSYGFSWKETVSTSFNIYDSTTSNTSNIIGDGFNPATLENKYFTAGRFIGVDAYEEYKIVINITNVHGVNGAHRWSTNKPCTWGVSLPSPENNQSTPVWLSYENNGLKENSNSIPQQMNKSFKPVIGDDPNKDDKPSLPKCNCNGYSVIKAPDQATCFSQARAAAFKSLNMEQEKVEPAYYAKIKDYNDINKDGLIPIKEENVTTIDEEYYGNSNLRIIFTMRIKYNVPPACINVKTGLVRYADKCDSYELTLPKIYSKNVDKYDEAEKKLYRIGQYFIPLNAKSTDEFIYSLEPRRKDGKELCESYIDNAKDMAEVRNTIRYIKNGKITAITESTKTKSEAKKLVAKGCYLTGKAKFNINQEFYNEKPSNNLEGYGVFFRPIDINNPFPNGLNEKSYWYNFYDLDTKKIINLKDALGNNIDIANSFNNSELNYKIYLTNNKIEDIKEFDLNANLSDKMYTSWKSMNKNGISNFITESRFDILKRISKGNKYSFYKLGCGPLNASWEECK